VLGHEDALFFGVYAFLVAALWLFDVPGRLRRTATAGLPLVLMADLVNSRRAAWLVLGAGLTVLGLVAWRALPARRLVLARIVAAVAICLTVYMPAFWNKTGGLAQPARAVRSVIAPDPRDASSDLYRIQEDANLKVNIQEGGLLGRGFGVRIDYPLPITDISDLDPLIDYVPHNGVYYVLLRMGIFGGVALWVLIGAAIIRGSRLARVGDRELAMLGAVLAAATVGYAFEGAVDQGFFFYRIAFAMGCLLALTEAARRMSVEAPLSAEGVERQAPDLRLDLNTATLEQLRSLRGIGLTTAWRILHHRERCGGFRSVEELRQVRGIGAVRLDALREAVRV